MCYQSSFGLPNRTHVVVKNATADAGVLVAAFRYTASGPALLASWCVAPQRSNVHPIADMIVDFKFDVGDPDCTHHDRFERDLAGGNANIAGAIDCTATITGRRPKYDIER
jgi:hypothetical protein